MMTSVAPAAAHLAMASAILGGAISMCATSTRVLPLACLHVARDTLSPSSAEAALASCASAARHAQRDMFLEAAHLPSLPGDWVSDEVRASHLALLGLFSLSRDYVASLGITSSLESLDWAGFQGDRTQSAKPYELSCYIIPETKNHTRRHDTDRFANRSM